MGYGICPGKNSQSLAGAQHVSESFYNYKQSITVSATGFQMPIHHASLTASVPLGELPGFPHTSILIYRVSEVPKNLKS